MSMQQQPEAQAVVRVPAGAPSAPRLLPLAGLVGGLLVGAVWGGLARLWMRLLADRPEFTWSGTIFIVSVFAVVGMTAGVVTTARRRHWRGHPMRVLRVIGMSGTVLLSLGQGAVMAPTLLFGSLALARRLWPLWLRVLLATLSLGPVVLVHAWAWNDWPHSGFRFLAAVALCLLVYGGAVAALAQSYAFTPGAALPRSSWLALLLMPLAVLFTLGVDSFGAAGGAAVVLALALGTGGAVGLHRRRRRMPPAELPEQRSSSAAPVEPDAAGSRRV